MEVDHRAPPDEASGSVGKTEVPDRPIAGPEIGGETITLLGTVEVTTHMRVTVPKKLANALHVDEGDFLLFFKVGENVIVKSEKGYKDPGKVNKKAEKK